jgi:hypothetical protein
MDNNQERLSYIDLLIIAINNFKFLLISSLFVGVISFIIINLTPNIFLSNAILSLPSLANSKQAAELMRSRLILSRIINPVSQSGEVVTEFEYLEFEKKIEVEVKKDGLIYLNVKGNSPQDAQRLAANIIDEWLKNSIPSGETVGILKKRLKNSEDGLKAVTILINKITYARLTTSAPLASDAILLKLNELQQNFQSDVVLIPRLLESDYHNLVKLPPTLPTSPISKSQSVIACISAIVTGAVLLLFLFARQVWRNGAMVPEKASKQALLLQALGLNPR